MQDAKGRLKRAFVGEEIKDGGDRRDEHWWLVRQFLVPLANRPFRPGSLPNLDFFPKEARPYYELGPSHHAAILSSNHGVGSDGHSLTVFVAERLHADLSDLRSANPIVHPCPRVSKTFSPACPVVVVVSSPSV